MSGPYRKLHTFPLALIWKSSSLIACIVSCTAQHEQTPSARKWSTGLGAERRSQTFTTYLGSSIGVENSVRSTCHRVAMKYTYVL
ncbi:hypothetical protein F5B18DRAFT_367934 [Nemania serpens]|nr:hypothetical protein F5B18DRAFT_367934 [Nemania serpens]